MADDKDRNEVIGKLLADSNDDENDTAVVHTVNNTGNVNKVHESKPEKSVKILEADDTPDIEMNDILEALAAIEHEQWMSWAKNILESEDISDERKERWEELFVPYEELSEEDKDKDREYAKKVLDKLKDFKTKPNERIRKKKKLGDLSDAFSKVIENKTKQTQEKIDFVRNKINKNVDKETIKGILHDNMQ